jgi:hypothetical protein
MAVSLLTRQHDHLQALPHLLGFFFASSALGVIGLEGALSKDIPDGAIAAGGGHCAREGAEQTLGEARRGEGQSRNCRPGRR